MIDFILKQRREWAVSAAVFLLFFRSRYAFTVYSSGDDACYTKWLYTFVGERYTGCDQGLFYFPGVAVFWWPGALLAKLLGLVSGLGFEAWISPLVGIWSFLGWVLSLFLSARILKLLHFKDKTAVFWLLSMPVLFYATHRVTMPHAAELLFGLIAVERLLSGSLIQASLVGVLLALTRITDVPLFLLILAECVSLASLKKISKPTKIILAASSLLVLWPTFMIAFVHGYHGAILKGVWVNLINREGYFLHVLFGADWGLIWTMPVWVALLVIAPFKWSAISLRARASWIWLAVSFLFISGLMWQGSSFGYRYLIGTFPAVLLLGAELVQKAGPRIRIFIQVLTIYSAVSLSALTWVFATQPELSLQVDVNGGWVNFQFLPEVLRLFAHPLDWIRPLGLSPIGTLVMSYGSNLSVTFSRYAIEGPALWTLTAATGAALGILALCLVGRASARPDP